MAPKHNTPLLEIKQLRSWIATRTGYVRAVDNISFSIQRGETFALLGESGCGKSLTALSITQLLPTGAYYGSESKVYLEGLNLLNLSEVEMQQIRGLRIGMIFQEPMTAINPVLTIGHQIEEIVIRTNLSRKQAKSRSVELLTAVGIPDAAKRYHDYAHQLSGGMKQRVMIAIALACDPDLLIADEPTTALDVTIQAQILVLLKKIQQQRGMAILLITHDLGIVWQMADRLAIMYAGHLVEQASSTQFFKQPQHPYSQQLLAALPNSRKREQALSVIAGSVPTLNQSFAYCRFKARCPQKIAVCEQKLPKWYQTSSEQSVRCHLYADKTMQQQKPPEDTSPALLPSSPPIVHEPLLQVKQLKVHFPLRQGILKRIKGVVKAVDGLNLSLTPGKTLALVGESGCGKTTTGKAIVQLTKPTSGDILLQGKPLAQHRQLHQDIQMIFQDPYASLNPRMTIIQILEEGIRAQHLVSSKTQRNQRIDEVLYQVGLSTAMKHRYPHEFSGGQRQRIAIARALVLAPKILICDEPTSALDVSVQAQILNVLKALQRSKHLAYLFITHNLSVVAYLADEIAVMYLGRIVEHGLVNEVLDSPKHPYTQILLAAVPNIGQLNTDEQLELIQGELPSPISPPQGCHFHPRCPYAMPQCKQQYPDQKNFNQTHSVHCFLYTHYPPKRPISQAPQKKE